MKTNQLFILTGLAAIASTSCSQKENTSGQPAKPMNILYIMTDDHSFQTISAYDKRYIQTPNIDRIANEGVRFTNSFVANSISGPSRACMLTGKHSHKNGFIDNAHTFDGSQQTFPKLLRKAGYQTAMIGKWHLTSDPTGFDYWNILVGQGDYYNPIFIDNGEKRQIEGYATNITTDLALDWLDNKRDKSKPFCLLLHHKAPHRTWMPDTCDLRLYDDVTFPLPENFYDDYAGRIAAEPLCPGGSRTPCDWCDYRAVCRHADGVAERGSFIVNPEGKIVAYEVNAGNVGRNADELLRKVQACQFVAEHGDEVCPAKWQPGAETLKPSLDLVGQL